MNYSNQGPKILREENVNTQFVKEKGNLKHTLPVTEIKLAGNAVITLIDTGSSICLLEQKIFNSFNTDKRIKHLQIDALVKSITGENLNITDCVLLPVQIGNKQFIHKFYIVKDALSDYYQSIIGYDLLKSKEFEISFNNNKLQSGNSTSQIRDARFFSASANNTIYAYIANKFTLKPGESKEIKLLLDRTTGKGELIKFFPCLKNPNIEFVNNIYTVNKDRGITVKVKNLSDRTIPFNKNTRAGSISQDFDTRDIENIKKLRREELSENDFELSHLDPETRSKLLALLFEYADIFSKRLYTIGRTEAIQPNLQVNLNDLPSIRPYPVPYALQDELRRQLTELQQANIIEPSNCHVSFPLILIKKKNPSGDPAKQTWRLVNDYRLLNRHLKYPRYKLPIIPHLLDKLRGNSLYTTLDLSNSFFQIPLKPEDRDMTTFCTPIGNFKYITMPQGLSAASETFSNLSDQILAPLSELNISNFIDDYAMGSKDVDEMLDKLKQLFERFRTFGITINPEKCAFFLPEIRFLGHHLNAQGIRPIEDNIVKIKDFPTPNTVKKIRRFVGLVSYYRKFIKNFSQISASLTDLTKKNQRFKWTTAAQTAFDKLKTCLSQAPILIHPDFNKPFILSTDASDHALGGMLGQADETGIMRPIAFFSKKLSPTQCKYTIMEKELLAIVQAVATFKHYLYGRHFTIKCDNSALVQLSKLESPGNRIARCFAFLSDYNYTFDLVKSEENFIADIFSRDFYAKTTNDTLNSAVTEEVSERKEMTGKNENTRNLKTNNNETINLHSTNKTTNDTIKELNSKKQLQDFKIGAGLQNLGNSCFMNTILQSISHLQPLNNYFLNDTFNCEKGKFCMSCIFKRHLNDIKKHSEIVIKPLEIYQHLHRIGKQFLPNRQADAHEFLRGFLNCLEQCHQTHLNGKKDNTNDLLMNPIKQLFEGNFQSQVRCLKCNKRSLTFDPFMDISLELTKDIGNIKDIMREFIKPELIKENYRCYNCKTNTEAMKDISIFKSPEIITLHLKRFEFSNMNTHKLTKFISYPNKFNFRPYMIKEQSKRPLWYNLKSVIVHSGNSVETGHYFCYIKDEKNNWYRMNDEEVERVTLHEVLNQEAYILMYENEENTPETIKSNNFIVNAIQINLPTVLDIKLAQYEDNKLSKIITDLKDNPQQKSHKYPNYFLKDNLLMHKAFIPRIRKTTDVEQIVIPDKYKPHILTAKHISHFGVLKTYNAIREKYFWENLFVDTKHFVDTCKQCISYKSPNKIPPIPIQKHFIPTRVNQFVSGDFVGPFHSTEKNNKYILTFIDHFTKFIRLYAVPNTSSKVAAECLMDFICIFGVPERYLTDKASVFTSEVFKELCNKFGVAKLTTTPQNPSCNGSAEKLNLNIKKSLAIFAEETAQWDDYLGYYSLIYNNSLHSTVSEKPAYLQLAYDQILPNDILNNTRPVEHVPYNDFVARKISQVQYVNEKVQQQLLKAAQTRQNYQHKKAKYREFRPNQLAYLHTRDCDRHKQTTKKRVNIGPYRILKRHNNVDYTIKNAMAPGAKEIKVHASRLIPYTPRKPELDLYNSLTNDSAPQDIEIQKKSVPHAVFDEADYNHLLWSYESTPLKTSNPVHEQSPEKENTDLEINSTDTQTHDNVEEAIPQDQTPEGSELGSTHSSADTDHTIIYTPPSGSPKNDQSPTRSYNLRDFHPRYDPNRFLQWALKITE